MQRFRVCGNPARLYVLIYMNYKGTSPIISHGFSLQYIGSPIKNEFSMMLNFHFPTSTQ